MLAMMYNMFLRVYLTFEDNIVFKQCLIKNSSFYEGDNHEKTTITNNPYYDIL